MKSNIPKLQLILGYKEFFNLEAPVERLKLLEGMCKLNVVTELAGLNYRLKTKTSLQRDISMITQINELKYFCGFDENIYKKYSIVASLYTKNRENYPLIFTRQMCLFGIEEVLSSNLKIIPDFKMSADNNWDKLLKYIIAVNSEITKISDDENINFENLNPKLLPLNELCIEVDPLFTPYRGFKLINYLNKIPLFTEHITQYFNEEYGFEYKEFIFNLSSIYFNNIQKQERFNFYYHIKRNDISIFKKLSQDIIINDPQKIIRIKKYPFYKVNEKEFLLIDNVLLLQKSYSQFINDFWFDYLKPRKIIDISLYKSYIGYFFENYVKEILDYSFINNKHFVLKMFDELKVNLGKNEIELTDIYIRYNSKIIVGEVKSTSLYDSERYSGNIDSFYRNDRNGFFKSFGVNQLIDTVTNLNDLGTHIDNKFPFNKVFQIYPILIVNEIALVTPLMADVFNNRFQELLPKLSSKIHVYPLSIIHISDLERVQQDVSQNPKYIFEILNLHCKDKLIIPPLYATLNKLNIFSSYKIPMEFLKELISKYSDTTTDIKI